jgi:DNA-binding beta-propeller fold protein YncE
VTPVRTATDTALSQIPVFQPNIIAVSPNGKIAYVSGINAAGHGTVTPIRTAANKALRPIKAPFEADSIVFAPNSKTAYLLGSNDKYQEFVVPVLTGTGRVLKGIKVSRTPDMV